MLLKKLVYSIKRPLTYIFNKSFSTGIYSEWFKLAKIILLHKNCPVYVTDNYRPISLLPVISRVLEKLMFKRMSKFVNVNRLLYMKQFGFRDKHSTQDTIAMFTADILKGFNNHFSVFYRSQKSIRHC